ncbi:uncharacterized protein LOC100159485 precursor [Acyrthosiphon pisum]|nr:uncharacterized protein LOC100159485 precursor [Acyrthosiphon pisum]BAH72410.1 ACYPI000852 [Acyrthosiphon pisum]|eukprot:NP_001156070.1 uncharacterized protein LOC100159485 precursor [Acyrthosiphon pisum]
MTTITLVAALFGCLLLHSFAPTSTAARMPDSDLPFEFNHKKGSIMTDDNVLTQSVSSDGQNVFKTNEPQPIKKYQKANTNNKNSPKNQNLDRKQRLQNNAANGAITHPAGHLSTSYYSTFPAMDEKNFFEHFSRLFPGFSNMRIEYV